MTASGASLGYQWFKGTAGIGGATASTLTLPSVSPSDAANYFAIVTNAFGIATSSDGVTFTREVFASQPDQVIVIRLHADKPGALAFSARLGSVHPTAASKVAASHLLEQRAGAGPVLVGVGVPPGLQCRMPA